MKRSKNVVTLGTGTGQGVLIRALKKRGCRIHAIAGVTDNGGSSKLIRESMNLPQPGDGRNCLTSMAEPGILRDLFSHRFQEGALKGMNLGNLCIAALTRISGSFDGAWKEAEKLLEIQGSVIPVSTVSTQICAILEDGRRIVGEWEIIRREPRTPIQQLYLKDPAPLNPRAKAAIEAGDVIIIGPGTLRTGIISALLTEGLPDALSAASALKVYICNLMTQPGQTDGFTASRHLAELERYLGFSPDQVIVNSGDVGEEFLEHFNSLGSEPVRDDLKRDGVRRGDFIERTSLSSLKGKSRPDNVPLLFHDVECLSNLLPL